VRQTQVTKLDSFILDSVMDVTTPRPPCLVKKTVQQEETGVRPATGGTHRLGTASRSSSPPAARLVSNGQAGPAIAQHDAMRHRTRSRDKG
jgi:hypothetical protein